MSRLKAIIGILILFTYLCPFVSCEAPIAETAVLTAADSTAMSDSILKANPEIAARVKMDTSASGNSVSKTDRNVSGTVKKATQAKDDEAGFWTVFFFPTKNSMSGLGELLNVGEKETANFLLVSFLLSIFTVLPLKNHYKIGRIFIAAVNLGCLAAFMYITALVDKQRLLWGSWLLLALVILHLFLEIRYKAAVASNKTGRVDPVGN